MHGSLVNLARGITMPTNIKEWNPEDTTFWETTGKKIAYRNLWISVPSLLNGFAIWLMWGIITVQMLNLGFPSPRTRCSP